MEASGNHHRNYRYYYYYHSLIISTSPAPVTRSQTDLSQCHEALLRYDINTECQHFEDVCNDLNPGTEYIFMKTQLSSSVLILDSEYFWFNYQFVLKSRG